MVHLLEGGFTACAIPSAARIPSCSYTRIQPLPYHQSTPTAHRRHTNSLRCRATNNDEDPDDLENIKKRIQLPNLNQPQQPKQRKDADNQFNVLSVDLDDVNFTNGGTDPTASQDTDNLPPPQQRRPASTPNPLSTGIDFRGLMNVTGMPRIPGFNALTRLSSSSSSNQQQPPTPPRSPVNESWSKGPDEQWDDWSGTPVADLDDEEDVAELREQVIKKRQERRGKRTVVRDEYLRPIVDGQGIRNRLAFDEKETEERVFVEAITNQYESREALKYGGTLIVGPLLVGFTISRMVAQPLWGWAENLDPAAFAPRDEQKIEGAEEIHREELRLRLLTSIGQAPPLTDDEMLQHLRQEAQHIAVEIREKNKAALLNVVSDSLSAGTLFVLLVQDNSQRAILFRTLGRIFTGLSDTAKAFLIILTTDILLGYHSEEGWTAALSLVSGHYGVSPEKELLQLFVATVPVFLDSLFKYWIFVELNKIDPAAAVTLRQMDRH